MKVVYLAHPLAGEVEQNRRNASRWVAWAVLHMGVAVVADWIVLTGELSEVHRELGLRVDCALIERCDEIWLVGGRISAGMTIELEYADKLFKYHRDFTPIGYEPPLGPVALPKAARL